MTAFIDAATAGRHHWKWDKFLPDSVGARICGRTRWHALVLRQQRSTTEHVAQHSLEDTQPADLLAYATARFRIIEALLPADLMAQFRP